jgi:polysaccharide pyruvyl transferase WcaK-like protein
VLWLVTKKYRVSMFTSDSPDRFAIDDLWGRLSVEMSPEELRSIERHHVATVWEFLDQASRVDLVVASRLHGVLLAQLVGTPVLALSYDRKVDVQMESVGHGFFLLNIDEFHMSDFQDRFGRLEACLETAREQIRARFSESRVQLEVQYNAIFLPGHVSQAAGGIHIRPASERSNSRL